MLPPVGIELGTYTFRLGALLSSIPTGENILLLDVFLFSDSKANDKNVANFV